ncbi:MAG: DegT/DnrJ/EryC1/StrS family aminotransferase, partial [Lachnospiraceae bacterium]|nr:DegT/DnrJ/EryC1/StrS family aminotransferase [Lachnospiraceae bacterium]
HRYDGQYGQLPVGYDHKYVYSHFGFNLKATDMQAAIGCAQLEKLDRFTALRKEHWNYLKSELECVTDKLILPNAEKGSKPSWFGFLISVNENAGFTRDELSSYLEAHNIQTRNLFAGNIIKHPCFDDIRENTDSYRVVGTLENTDFVMNRGFWIGVYPEMSKPKLDYMIKTIKQFIEMHR